MDPGEVIVIDDSPLTSPDPENASQLVTDYTMTSLDLRANRSEFCSPNETMAWSQFTTKFISSTMNSVISNAGRSATDLRRRQHAAYNTANTTSTYNFAHTQLAPPFSYYTQNCQYTSCGHYTDRSSQQDYMRNIHPMDDYYCEYRNSTIYAARRTAVGNENYGFYNGYFQAPLRASQNRESPANGVSTAVTSDTDDKTIPSSEYVDVNALLANHGANVSLPANVLLNPNRTKTKRPPTLPTGVRDNRRTTYPGVSLSKLSRAMHLRQEAMDEETNVALDLSKHQETSDDSDNSDVIFVGIYKTGEKVPGTAPAGNVTNHDTKPGRRGIRGASENPDAGAKEGTGTHRAGKLGLPAPRRNPRRQVQFAKSLKAVNEVSYTPKTRSKVLRKSRKKNPPIEKNLRRSLRQLSNCGAVYCPPSPITSKHFRDWPVEGMHERPEYNPVTKQIEPFDCHIRSISKKYKSPSNANDTVKSVACHQDEEDALAPLCHDLLHHVLAYVATVKTVQRQVQDVNKLRDTENSTKTTFMTNLALNKHNSFGERVCDVFKDTVKGASSNRPASDVEVLALRELIENTILLYCFTNNVTKSEVAKYIASIKPHDIIRFSNEKFALSECVPN